MFGCACLWDALVHSLHVSFAFVVAVCFGMVVCVGVCGFAVGGLGWQLSACLFCLVLVLWFVLGAGLLLCDYVVS